MRGSFGLFNLVTIISVLLPHGRLVFSIYLSLVQSPDNVLRTLVLILSLPLDKVRSALAFLASRSQHI